MSKVHAGLLLLVSAACLAWPAAHAQSAAAPPASSAAAGKNTPRKMSPAETRDSAQIPGDLRPEERVIPQISVPLGKSGPTQPVLPPKTAAERRRMGATGIDDSLARCKAETSQARREDCLSSARKPKPAP